MVVVTCIHGKFIKSKMYVVTYSCIYRASGGILKTGVWGGSLEIQYDQETGWQDVDQSSIE